MDLKTKSLFKLIFILLVFSCSPPYRGVKAFLITKDSKKSAFSYGDEVEEYYILKLSNNYCDTISFVTKHLKDFKVNAVQVSKIEELDKDGHTQVAQSVEGFKDTTDSIVKIAYSQEKYIYFTLSNLSNQFYYRAYLFEMCIDSAGERNYRYLRIVPTLKRSECKTSIRYNQTSVILND